MSNPIVNIDCAEKQLITVARGQILRVSISPENGWLSPNDDMQAIVSYAQTVKSRIGDPITLENGITLLSNGNPYFEVDTGNIRSCHDHFYIEWEPYGTAVRTIVIKVGLNNSAFSA